MGTFNTIGTLGVLDFEPSFETESFGGNFDLYRLGMPASTLTFEGVVDWDSSTKDLFFGDYQAEAQPEHSVVLEWDEDVPCPQPPDHIPGFWAWVSGVNRCDMDEFWERYDAWVLNRGKVKMQMFIPVANVQVQR